MIDRNSVKKLSFKELINDNVEVSYENYVFHFTNGNDKFLLKRDDDDSGRWKIEGHLGFSKVINFISNEIKEELLENFSKKIEAFHKNRKLRFKILLKQDHSLNVTCSCNGLIDRERNEAEEYFEKLFNEFFEI
ncbi:MAG: hypothetical protein N4A44_00325 [Alphaproteobacteria bacterium]|jgi:hypothetical protein|nr:hypothetical protein [Alphaproteobacteria bacterium]